MSTRAQIGFYRNQNQNLSDFEALIYQHSDGYPDSENGVIANLAPFLRKFHRIRGLSDIEYASARTLQHLMNGDDELMIEYSQNYKETPYGLLGYGISNQFHGDIEYLYAVYSTGMLKVYETSMRTGNIKDNVKLIKTFDLSAIVTPEFEAMFKDFPLRSQRKENNPLVIAKLIDWDGAALYITEYDSDHKMVYGYLTGMDGVDHQWKYFDIGLIDEKKVFLYFDDNFTQKPIFDCVPALKKAA